MNYTIEITEEMYLEALKVRELKYIINGPEAVPEQMPGQKRLVQFASDLSLKIIESNPNFRHENH